MSGRHRQHLRGYLDIHRGQPGGSRQPSQQENTHRPRSVEKPVQVQAKSKQPSATRPKVNLHVYKKIPPKIIGTPSINNIPDEILLKIFSYFTAQDLLCAARVCKRWLDLANDNLLWLLIYKKHGKQQRSTGSSASATERPTAAYWKTLCIRQCAEERNKRALRLLKKTDPFTGLPRETEKALRSAGVFYQLVLVDQHKTEYPLRSRDVFYHNMSVSVRWFDLEMPPVNSIQELRVYAGSPLFFKQDGVPVKYSPFQRSLLLTMAVRWENLMKTTQPSGADDMINLYVLTQGFLLATWKGDGEIAFIAAGLPTNHLTKSCLLGTSNQPYQPPEHKVVADDIDSSYGLHDYGCTVEIRTLRQSVWSQQYNCLNCRRDTIGKGYAVFQLIRKDHHTDHVVLQKKVSLPWKTDAFKGVVENVIWMDVTVLDERKEPFWCISSPVRMSGKVSRDDFNFDYTSQDVFVMSCVDEKGKLVAELSQTDHGEHFITSLDLMLSLQHINQWFGTNY